MGYYTGSLDKFEYRAKPHEVWAVKLSDNSYYNFSDANASFNLIKSQQLGDFVTPNYKFAMKIYTDNPVGRSLIKLTMEEIKLHGL